MESARALLSEYNLRALETLQKQTDGVFVFGTAGANAEWRRDARLVVIQQEYVADFATSPADVAATLVHEATHVSLERLGFHYTAQRRARIEAVCYRRALRFARRLPGASDLVAKPERQLMRDPVYLTDEAFRGRIIAELRRLGVPNWLVRVIERSSRRLRRLKSAWTPPE